MKRAKRKPTGNKNLPKGIRGKRVPLISKSDVAAFGATIKQSRISHFGHNVSESARALGISRNLLERIEGGRLIPKADVYLRLCKEFNLDAGSALAEVFRPTVNVVYSSPQYGKVVRIIAEPVRAPGEKSITLDAAVDDQHRIVSDYPILGVWGTFDDSRRKFSPFVLSKGGEVIYDGEYPTKYRYWDCDIRHVEISKGTCFTYSAKKGPRVKYRIVNVLPLLET